MSDHNLAEALRRIANAKFGMTTADAFHLQSIAREALAAHEAEQQAGEAVAWVDERAIAWLNGRSGTATITTKLQAGKSLERPMPLFTHPQQPLTEIRRLAIIMQARTIREAIEMTEDAHGITKDTK